MTLEDDTWIVITNAVLNGLQSLLLAYWAVKYGGGGRNGRAK